MLTGIKAAVISEPDGQFVIKTVELDDLRSDEIMVRIEACGICHTDIIAQNRIPLPAVLGHEGCGVIEAVGSAVDGVKEGDRVIISMPFCSACPTCVQGKTYICENAMSLVFAGTRMDGSRTISVDGKYISSAYFQQSSFATHAIALGRAVVPVEEYNSPVMMAAIACGIQTGAGSVFNLFKVKSDQGLVVFGAGSVGLSAIMAGKVAGASPLIAVDVIQSRLKLAIELGATHALNANDGDVAEEIREIAPHGMNFSLETSGNEKSFNNALACLGMGGTCGIVTIPNDGEPFPFSPLQILDRGASIQGILMGNSIPRSFLPELIALNRKGQFPYERLITTYDFSDINKAFADTKAGITIKPVLIMNDMD